MINPSQWQYVPKLEASCCYRAQYWWGSDGISLASQQPAAGGMSSYGKLVSATSKSN